MADDQEHGPAATAKPVTVGELADATEKALRVPMAQIAESLRTTAGNLRIPVSTIGPPASRSFLSEVPMIPLGPSEEVEAMRAVELEVASLREVSAASSEQIAAIADIADDLKPALESYARSAWWSNLILLLLTFVLVVLTAVLVFRTP